MPRKGGVAMENNLCQQHDIQRDIFVRGDGHWRRLMWKKWSKIMSKGS